MFKDSAPFKNPAWIPDVDELYCAYGVGVKTTERMVWKQGQKFPTDVPEFIYGDGDGTVNIRSLSLCKQWPLKGLWTFPGSSHVSVLSDKRLHSKMKSVLFKPDKLR